MPPNILLRHWLLFALLLLFSGNVIAQSILDRKIDVDIRKRPLDEALQTIAKKGNFTFSYVSNIISQDSIVSISQKNASIREILDKLLNGDYQYKEHGNYLILQYKPPGVFFYVSGVVTDKATGQRVPNASVYERQQLISTLTNNDGYFRLRLRDKSPAAAISVSKDLYSDTLLMLSSGADQEIKVSISPYTRTLQTVEVTGHAHVERTWFGRMFLSSRQKAQSLNISQFFADKPYQVSLLPGLGTHGRMSGQVVNKLSLNVLGGYTAGVDGVEVAGAFNIVKNDVHDVQVAGLVNITGGKMIGVQVSGMHNNVLDSMRGVQAAGISNIISGNQDGVQISGAVEKVKQNMTGVQVAGILASTGKEMNGVQVSGAANFTGDTMHGVQLAGLYNSAGESHGAQISAVGNVTKGTVKGVQISSMFNKAKRLDGVQIGFVNIADTSNGYSIGIVNIIKTGYHKVSLFSTELLPVNVAWKTGNQRLYGIMLGGVDFNSQRSYTYGYGMGTERMLRNKHFSVLLEATAQQYHMGYANENSQLYRFSTAFQYRPGRMFAIYGGPVISIHRRDQPNGMDYKEIRPGVNYPGINFGDNGRIWIGWHIGLTIF
ncbi:STN and carboxypeptidase regulatory-like domain-containing protein [Chitinophaga sp. Cy-1792]|uniref:STN and carboxypeptidase regulatory-like domain-containing protein n=1 Tax=Chitinophaga sp. Cy-1792 TaxID=2608339 RepID=UPI00141FED5D|nr:STN and carboxypeptidase regulatory-like domain-containing protein [Chitinophaga sp. Cy-1792]NIG57402.1 hypothetical protein [Chitinophaga sp. Cy-1792]